MAFALEFLVGAVTYVYEPQVDDELLVTLNKTFSTSYGIDSTRSNAIDLMQQNVCTLPHLQQIYLLMRKLHLEYWSPFKGLSYQYDLNKIQFFINSYLWLLQLKIEIKQYFAENGIIIIRLFCFSTNVAVRKDLKTGSIVFGRKQMIPTTRSVRMWIVLFQIPVVSHIAKCVGGVIIQVISLIPDAFIDSSTIFATI